MALLTCASGTLSLMFKEVESPRSRAPSRSSINHADITCHNQRARTQTPVGSLRIKRACAGPDEFLPSEGRRKTTACPAMRSGYCAKGHVHEKAFGLGPRIRDHAHCNDLSKCRDRRSRWPDKARDHATRGRASAHRFAPKQSRAERVARCHCWPVLGVQRRRAHQLDDRERICLQRVQRRHLGPACRCAHLVLRGDYFR